jgi:hypothetical protein
MKNMLGEEREPQKLSIDQHGFIKRGDKIFGYIKPNGWNGSQWIDFEVGEPIVTIFPSNALISFKEMQFLMDEWSKLKVATEVDAP